MPFIHLHTWLIVFCGLIPWLWIPTSQAAVDEEPPKPISMEVFLKIPKLNTYEFHIYLTNISGESLTIDLHTLPWLPPGREKGVRGREKGVRNLIKLPPPPLLPVISV